MSGLTEQEVLSKYKQSLAEARDACQWLAKNADPLYFAPRGRHYRLLKTALKELEGASRQMCAFRSDTRWVRLGIHFAKRMQVVQRLFANHNWLAFGQLVALFDNDLVHADELTHRKTGTLGPLLPKNPSAWIIMPDALPPRRQLWMPHGRLPN